MNVKIDYAITNNLTPFIVMQNHYNLIYREEEREMIPTLKVCRAFSVFRSLSVPPVQIYLSSPHEQHLGVGMIPWSPIAKGLLTRPLKEQTQRGETDWVIKRYLEGGGTREIVSR